MQALFFVLKLLKYISIITHLTQKNKVLMCIFIPIQILAYITNKEVIL